MVAAIKIGVLAALCISLLGCAGVREEDTRAWENASVEALDLHPLFLTMQMRRTFSEGGVEIRVYSNKVNMMDCDFGLCVSKNVGCDNIFYIKDGRVLRYLPVGRCYTNPSLQPL